MTMTRRAEIDPAVQSGNRMLDLTGKVAPEIWLLAKMLVRVNLLLAVQCRPSF